MLDAWFMSRLNSQGKKWYWIGQLTFLLVLALIVFGAMGMGLEQGIGYLAGIGLVLVLGWGFLCKAFWPDED